MTYAAWIPILRRLRRERIRDHVRAVREAKERPGVMIRTGLAAWVPAVEKRAEVARRAYGIPPDASAGDQFRSLMGPALGGTITSPISIPATERTCSTCSKTCDVGVKCWWCGNG